jgi:heme-degrading monooxygenase HmoA
MHAAVRIYQVDPGSVDEFEMLVNETFLPIIKEAPGFQAYYSLDTGDGRIASVSVFDDRAGAEESTKMAADNIRQKHGIGGPDSPGGPGRGSLRNRSGLGGTVGRGHGHGGRGHGHGRRGHGQPLGRRREEELAKSGHPPPTQEEPRGCTRARAARP